MPLNNKFALCVLQEIILEPPNKAIDIAFEPSLTIHKGTDKMSLAAMVTYNARAARKSVNIDKGNIVVVTKDGQRLVITYQAEVEQG